MNDKWTDNSNIPCFLFLKSGMTYLFEIIENSFFRKSPFDPLHRGVIEINVMLYFHDNKMSLRTEMGPLPGVLTQEP